ncbi:MAG: hypothetical protein M3N47_04670, partial [Chloroflexota bacterium]|nr:hypothetical protein [Chloroflexota bacterium]
MNSITLLVLGVGTVGGEVVRQAVGQRTRWREQLDLDVVVGGVAGRAGALVADDEAGLPEERLAQFVDARRRAGAFEEALGASDRLQPAAAAIDVLVRRGALIVVDAAAGEITAELDARALDQGAGVVLSNKAPLALPHDDPRGRTLWAAAGAGGRLRYEATCGAGL